MSAPAVERHPDDVAHVSDLIKGAPGLGALPASAVAVLGLVEQLVARTVEVRGELATLGDYVAAIVTELAPILPALDQEAGEALAG